MLAKAVDDPNNPLFTGNRMVKFLNELVIVLESFTDAHELTFI